MLSSSQIKSIKNLQNKKFRREYNLFVAEGPRLVHDITDSRLEVTDIFFTPAWSPTTRMEGVRYFQIGSKEMERISGLTTPSEVLALVRIPSHTIEFDALFGDDLTLILDDIQDPGNLGTIIRLADWFGIEKIICTAGTADAYSPKVVQATMGSIARVTLAYYDAANIIAKLSAMDVPVYGTYLDGESIFRSDLKQNGVIILGNEGNGISKEFEQVVKHRLTIPSFVKHDKGSQSLNVATAAAIVCAEFRRRKIGS